MSKEQISFNCDGNLSKYSNSLRFADGTKIARLKYKNENNIIDISLVAKGNVETVYKGTIYFYYNTLPEQAKKLIAANKGNSNGDIYIRQRNGFEFIYSINGMDINTIPCDIDFSKMSLAEFFENLLEIAKSLLTK